MGRTRVKIRSKEWLDPELRSAASSEKLLKALNMAEKQLEDSLVDSRFAMYKALNKKLLELAKACEDTVVDIASDDGQKIFDNILKLAEKTKKMFESLEHLEKDMNAEPSPEKKIEGKEATKGLPEGDDKGDLGVENFVK